MIPVISQFPLKPATKSSPVKPHRPSTGDDSSEPGPIAFTREELIEIDAIIAPELGFLNGLIEDDGDAAAHLVNRRAMLNSIRAKIQSEFDGRDL